MPMREECKNYQSRTYGSGEVARLCILDLAPEAPWRCPENCPSYVRRLADAGWTHGSLIEPPIEDEPEGEHVAELLDEAEDIVNAVVASAREEVQASRDEEENVQYARGFRRLFRKNNPKRDQ
ncbi:MAG TPA: hypothetical protein VNE42_10935 [Acidimicrobiales bacterium]|nr:hypothetical protein [Acidimicrobiales bacterium]